MPKITRSVKRLTGDTVRDDENADWLAIWGGTLNPRDINIQDLLQPGAGRSLTCSGVSNEQAKGPTG